MERSRDGEIHARGLAEGTRVEVHPRFELGRWVSGFTIAEVRGDEYRIRRDSDGAVLREPMSPEEVRGAGAGHESAGA